MLIAHRPIHERAIESLLAKKRRRLRSVHEPEDSLAPLPNTALDISRWRRYACRCDRSWRHRRHATISHPFRLLASAATHGVGPHLPRRLLTICHLLFAISYRPPAIGRRPLAICCFGYWLSAIGYSPCSRPLPSLPSHPPPPPPPT